jgi:putative ABC transport system permease protein
VYVDYSQRPQSTETFTVVMRSSSDSISLFPGALATLRDIDPNVPPRLNTFHEVLSTSLAWRRFSLILVGAFSCLALLLAGIGIYGVTSYAVSRRTREFGVRMALGAEKGNVLQLVLSQGLLTTAVGLIAGIGGALLLTKTIQSMLFNTSPFDPLTFGAVGILLLFATLLACYLPALRATRVDPMVALRYE